MKVPMLIISAASLVALGNLAKADDHLFQAVDSGGLSEEKALSIHDSPGRGSPFTSFSDNVNEQGVPSADPEVTASEHGAHELPTSAGPKK
jgi:hypothetical protein